MMVTQKNKMVTKTKDLYINKFIIKDNMVKRGILLLFVMILLSSLSLATSDFMFKQNDAVDIKVPCYNPDNSKCNSNTNCSILINFPDGTNLINNGTMSYSGDYFNISFESNSFGQLGIYPSSVSCVGETANGFRPLTIEITPTGTENKNNLLPIIAGFIFLIIFFTAVGASSQDDFGIRFISYAFALIQLIFMVGVLFIYESGGILIGLLKVNFYTMAIVGFGVGMYALFMHSLRIATPEVDLNAKADAKWDEKSKW